jgi:predicted permease
LRSDYQTPLWLLLAIAGMVLLIACANLANLMLARAGAREREIAVRLALGAARGRLIRQLLTESALLAAAGAVAGVVLAQYLSRFMVAFLSTQNSQVFVDLSMNWRMIVFTVAVAALTCLLFGLAPAIKASGSSPAHAMKTAGRTLTATRERFSLRRALVVAQVALSLVLVVSAFLFVRTLRNLGTLDAGFQREGILILEADFTRLNIPLERRVQFRERLLERVRAVPGVESAAHTSIVPLSGNGWNETIIIDNQVREEAFLTNISPGYFRTIGTPLLAGRDFDSRDSLHAPRVAIVTETFVQKFLPGQNPIGKTFSYEVGPSEPQPVFEIVGLAKASKYYHLREDFMPIAFSLRRRTSAPTRRRSS